jgi:hypothetical protein
MARYKGKEKTANPNPRFRNVALLPDDHALLRSMAAEEQRTMTRQLSVIIKREHESRKGQIK